MKNKLNFDVKKDNSITVGKYVLDHHWPYYFTVGASCRTDVGPTTVLELLNL